jgi:hypothetical protein
MSLAEKINYKIAFFIWCLFLSSGVVITACGFIIGFDLLIIVGGIEIAIMALIIMPITRSIDHSKAIIEEYLSQKKQPNPDAESYHAIIIANSTTCWKKMGIFTGVDQIVEKLKIENCEYKICLCNNQDEAKKEIEEPKAKFLYLFGHGFRGGLTFYHPNSSSSQLNYVDVNAERKKNFIGQFHCNSGNELSLIDHLLIDRLSEGNYYFHKGWTTAFVVWYDIHFKVLKKVKKC